MVQVFKNASNLIGFRALKGTFCQKILNHDFEVRDWVTKNALGMKIMFTKYKKERK